MELENNYPDLKNYLRLFKNSKDYILSSNGEEASILIKSCNLQFHLKKSDLNNLSLGKNIIKRGFSHLNYFGFTYRTFGEISILVVPYQYAFLKDTFWNSRPLKFKIGPKLFEISNASPLFVLLNEPIYRDGDWQYNFENFTTLKIQNTNVKEIKSDIIKALYYLNSKYLKNIGFLAKVYHMKINYDFEFDLDGENLLNAFRKINRTIKDRDDFISLEPLIFYNQAQTYHNDEKFLYLYRILEFFMHRAKMHKVAEMRYNQKYSDYELIKVFDGRSEEILLSNLINQVLNLYQKKKISNYAFSKNLIKEDNYKLLSKSLYKYRNSVVHAKELQIIEMKIPDMFEIDEDNNPWLYIIDELAKKCITKYNINQLQL